MEAHLTAQDRMEDLSEEAREKDFEFVRELPTPLAGVGFQMLRLSGRT